MEGNPAQILAAHCYRLAANIAKKYQGLGLPYMDLIQEGNVGLYKAAKRFDPGKGVRFTSFATLWIRREILRALANRGRMIRIPVYMLAQLRGMKKIRAFLNQELGREPTREEVALELARRTFEKREGRSVGFEEIGEAARKKAKKKVDLLSKISPRPLSLQQPINPGDEDSDLQIDFIKDQAPQPESVLSEDSELKECIAATLSQLTPRQERIIRLRFGIDDGRERTREEIARMFVLSRQRIEQIEKVALKRLRHPARSRKLKPFL